MRLPGVAVVLATLATVALLALQPACKASSGAFVCFSDEECRSGGEPGRCEATGFCSFVDSSCVSGQRYGAFAGDGLAGRCVPGAGELPDAGTDPDGPPPPPCGSIGDECCTTEPACLDDLVCDDGLCGCRGMGRPTIGAYAHHTCTTLGDGSGWCWGSNSQGQIGTGSEGGSSTRPAEVADLTGVTMMATGGAHTCAIADGEVWCWGDNDAGQSGTAGSDRPRPRRTMLTGATYVDTGGATTCAVAGGLVHCWGRNGNGQVGDGTTVDRNKPREVLGLTGIVAVTSGVTVSCALASDATAYCWGAGDEGQIGDGGGRSSLVPVKVALSGIVQIAAGDDHVCARTTAGLVYCWGDNEAGSIGDGTRERRTLPTPVAGLTEVAEVDVADEYACARKDDGTVWCWGRNRSGQLGAGRTSEAEPLPVQVLGIDDATAIATGAEHACARRAIGAIVCWGSSTDGQVGDDGTSARLEPTPARLECR